MKYSQSYPDISTSTWRRIMSHMCHQEILILTFFGLYEIQKSPAQIRKWCRLPRLSYNLALFFGHLIIQRYVFHIFACFSCANWRAKDISTSLKIRSRACLDSPQTKTECILHTRSLPSCIWSSPPTTGGGILSSHFQTSKMRPEKLSNVFKSHSK